MKTIWTQEQINALKKYYYNYSIDMILRMPIFSDKTYHAIKNKVARLGLIKSGANYIEILNSKKWSAEQIEFLQNNIDKLSYSSMANHKLFYGFTKKDIADKASELKITKIRKIISVDTNTIKGFFNTINANGTIDKRYKVPHLNKAFTSDEISIIIDGIQRNKSKKELSKLLNRPLSSIYNKIKTLQRDLL